MDDTEERIEKFIQFYEREQDKYKKFSEKILQMLISVMNERKMLFAYHSSRAKKVESLTAKCRKKILKEGEYVFKYNDPKRQITDLAGVRIVCYLPQDISPIQRIVENTFHVDVNNSLNKADGLGLDTVGYLSVHYIVSLKEEYMSPDLLCFKGMKCEIQLRTVLQDAWSQVFHDRQYKNNAKENEIPKEILRETNLISGALELLDNQIGGLVRKYDSFFHVFDNIDYQELLDSEISKANIEKYIKIKFYKLGSRFFSYNDMFVLMEKYGITTIRQLAGLYSPDLVDAILAQKCQMTIDKILMYGMIIGDADKFFSIEGNQDLIISDESVELLTKFIDFKDIKRKYKLGMNKGEEKNGRKENV